MIVPSDTPPQLQRFPAEVQAAYQRFRASRDEAAVQVVVLAALRDFLPREKQALRDRPLAAHERLTEDLGYDSLAVAELVFFFEDLFQVTISTREIQGVQTVGELRAFVARKLAANGKPA